METSIEEVYRIVGKLYLDQQISSKQLTSLLTKLQDRVKELEGINSQFQLRIKELESVSK